MHRWSIDFGDGTPSSSDLDHIARLVIEGYTSGAYHGEIEDDDDEV